MTPCCLVNIAAVSEEPSASTVRMKESVSSETSIEIDSATQFYIRMRVFEDKMLRKIFVPRRGLEKTT
jgi:hypothetical protein